MKSKQKKFGCGTLVSMLIILAVLFILRERIMLGAANFLIHEDQPEQVDAIFVLSGSPFDRGNKAFGLYKEALAPLIVCTGENQPHDFKAMNIPLMESEITAEHLKSSGIPDSLILILAKGTSTQEEALAILEFCELKDWDEIMIVSSRFHTRRIYKTFKRVMREADIEFNIQGAPSSVYDEYEWWNNEYGLIALNNEYIKLFYYAVKY